MLSETDLSETGLAAHQLISDDDVYFYNSTASTWTLATPRTTSESVCSVLADLLVRLSVGPLIIESLWTKKRVSSGALRALDDPLEDETKISKSV